MVLLNKTDKATPQQSGAVEAFIRKLNQVRVMGWKRAPGKLLLLSFQWEGAHLPLTIIIAMARFRAQMKVQVRVMGEV